MHSPVTKKTIISLLSVLLLVETGVFVSPKDVLAQGPTALVYDTATAQVYGLNKSEDIFRIGVVGAAMTGLISAVNFMAQKIAYDTAEQISEGNVGKAPLFDVKNWGNYTQDLLDQSFGFMLEALNESGLAPFNLCDPGNASLNISLALGWVDAQQPKAPACSFSTFKDNYKNFAQRVKTGEALKQFSIAFEPAQSPLGVAVDSSSRVAVTAANALNAGIQSRIEGQGFISVGDSITGKVKTPAQLVREKAIEGNKTGKEAQGISYDAMGKALVAAPGVIALGAANTFINHLVAKLLTKVLQGGLYYTLADATCALGITGCGGLSDYQYGSSAGTGAFRAQNTDLITPPLQADSHYQPLEEFATCPDQFRTVNNCVIDSQLSAALSRGTVKGKFLTVQEAMDQGYLHPEWPLISNSEIHRARNADPYCFTNAYCYSNLVKLRKHRILPIGWELAAAKSKADPIKLGEVVSRFNDCPTAEDPNPNNHPWCHLIDPNWVLKLPVTQCRLRVNGATLLSDDAPGRAQTCVDTPSCLAEDEFGNCTGGYGYCAKDKNIWRLGGRECKAPYASCASFTGRTGENLLALQNTIDHSVCTADNVGCLGYHVSGIPATSTEWSYTPGTNRVFLNKEVAACEADDAGCTQVIDKEGLFRNMALNPGFEQDTVPDAGISPKYWSELGWPTNVQWVSDTSVAHSGSRYIVPAVPGNAPDTFARLSVPVEPDMTYTVSFSLRGKDPNTAGAISLFGYLIDDQEQPFSVDNTYATCTIANGPNGLGLSVNGFEIVQVPPADGSWGRAACTFVTLPDGGIPPGGNQKVRPSRAVFHFSNTAGTEIYVDDLQVEEGAAPTPFHDSAYEGGRSLTYKIPPTYLGCTGNKAVDPAACAQYAPVCKADEVGCNRYTPEAGGAPITAITAAEDACPAVCVGYETFRKEPSSYDVAAYPKYFIPTTATQCSATSAGCTEFTNLDAQAAGGEAREYFTDLRLCEKPSGNTPTYYTWEGSDTTGYQLKEWHLKSGLPIATAVDPEAGTPPEVIQPYDATLCSKAIFQTGNRPDCREFFDVNGNVSYRLYSRTIVITDDCHPFRITKPPVREDAKQQSDCPNDHWLAGSNTCVVCEGVGGVWNSSDASCLFQGYKQESTTCGAKENGCRLYTGNAGANVELALSEDFESAAAPGWNIDGITVTTSTESTIVGGHSLRISGNTSITRRFDAGTPPDIAADGVYLLEFWAKGGASTFQDVTLVPALNPSTPPFITASDNQDVDGNWHFYSVGPVRVQSGDLGGSVILSFSTNLGSNQFWYLDNVVLKKVGSAIAVVQDSWETPLVCDQTANGIFLPQAQLGCAAYTDRKSEQHALKSFDRLCRDAAVGCRAFLNTQNNEFIGYEYWNATAMTAAPVQTPTGVTINQETVCTVATNNSSCRFHQTSSLPPTLAAGTSVTCSRTDVGPCYIDGVYICTISVVNANNIGTCTVTPSDLVTVAPDKTQYVVEDEAYACQASQAGCTETGVPTGAVCTLNAACSPQNNGTSCPCSVQTEICLPGQPCSLQDQFVCDVASGQTTCTFALPNKEPYPGLTYNTQTVVLNPNLYDRQICTGNAVGCEEWRSANLNAASVAYFKSPDGRLCEYRENVQISNATYAGYFIQGTDSPCDPTFLINGNYYGIRKNADSNYQGFVGSCPADQAGCTEYIDPTDYGKQSSISTIAIAEAERYYYIKDKNVDYSSCNGQASQKEGCILMNDTSDLNLYYNAVGTYNDSAKKAFAPAPTQPGVCEYWWSCSSSPTIPSGVGPGWAYTNDTEVTLLTLPQRTFGSHSSTFFESSLTTSDVQGLCAAANPPSPAYGVVIYYQERGCSADADCTLAGSAGFGYCNTVKQANTVIKVARDRICGEWFACKSSTLQWDQRANRFRDTCDEVGLCDQQSDPTTTSGSTDITSCKHWVTDPAEQQILSESLYQSRPISWTGLEYSGYSIPHQFPASALTQATLGRYCSVLDGNGNKISCQSAADCPPVPNGPAHAPCQAEGSLAHDVGICDDDDGAGCYSRCASETDAIARGICTISASIGGVYDGTCFAHRCYQSPFGNNTAEAFDQPQPLVSGATLSLACRAYPEADSPVPTDVVTGWNIEDNGVPSQIKQGFQSANVCLNGQDCECSYQKVQYGQAGKRYTSINDDVSQSIPGVCSGGNYDGMVCDPNLGVGLLLKRLSGGGLVANHSCTSVDVQTLDQTEGKCLAIKQDNYVRGLQGYCLERDEVTPIYGRQDSSPDLPGRACLTWFPVDRISGQPDIYNQYDSATYELGDSYQCLIPQMYKVVHTFGEGHDNDDIGPQGGEGGAQYVVSNLTGQGMWVGCASTETCTGPGCNAVNNYDTIYDSFPDAGLDYDSRGKGNMFLDCPPSTGFIVASYHRQDHQSDPLGCEDTSFVPGDDILDLCSTDGSDDDNFRYFCVPWGSVHTSPANGQLYGQECKPSDVTASGVVYEHKHGPCGDSQWKRLNASGSGSYDNFSPSLCATSYIPKFDAKYWDPNSPPIQYGLVTGDTTPVLVISDKLCSNEVLGRMSDCWKIDAPVTGTQEEPYYGATDNAFLNGSPHADIATMFGGPLPSNTTYLGCGVLAQVSKQGSSAEDTNKAYTNHVGGTSGVKPPGGDAQIGPSAANSPEVQQYTFDTLDTPYGGGAARGLDINAARYPLITAFAASPTGGKLAPYIFVGSGGNICDAGGNGCYNYGVDASDKYNFGINSLHQIFTKAYNYLGWSFYPSGGKTSKGYVDLTEFVQSQDSIKYSTVPTPYAPGTPNDITQKGTYSEFKNLWTDTSTGNVPAINFPKIIGVGTCDVDNHCYEDLNTSLNINGLSFGDIIGGGGWKRASFKFFAHAGLDADPIRDVRVIWDVKSSKADTPTGNSGQFLGLYKNHRGFENKGGVQTPVCGNGDDFGTTPDACDDSAPFTFVHNYTCNAASPHCEDGSDVCWNPNYVLQGEVVGKPACVYNPGVYVLNNWGLCLGKCDDSSSPGGILCSSNGGSSFTIDNASAFADPQDANEDECSLDNQNLLVDGNQPYIKYSGNIVVYPEEGN